MVKDLAKKTFQKAIEDAAVVLFWTSWSKQSTQMKKVIDSLEKQYKKVTFGTVNADRHTDIASEQIVVSVPTIILYKKSKDILRLVGDVPEELLAKEVEDKL